MKKIAIGMCFLTILAGCGGGGGGSSSGGSGGGSSSQPTFTSWGAIKPNTTTAVSGTSQEVSYTANPATDLVTSLSPLTPNESGATYFLTTNANNQASAISIRSARGTTVTFNNANRSTLASAVRYFPTPQFFATYTGAITGDGTSAALAADERAAGWNYQSYGVWISGRGTGAGTAGAASVGALTQAGNIPTVGSATFRGTSAGIYVGPQGNYLITTAFMNADVSFANRTVNLSTINTSAASAASIINGSFGTSTPALNISGSLSYAPGTNSISGAVTTAGSSNGTPMTGTAKGAFFGPNANEIGGTFGVKGTGMETFAGGFGGKR